MRDIITLDKKEILKIVKGGEIESKDDNNPLSKLFKFIKGTADNVVIQTTSEDLKDINETIKQYVNQKQKSGLLYYTINKNIHETIKSANKTIAEKDVNIVDMELITNGNVPIGLLIAFNSVDNKQ